MKPGRTTSSSGACRSHIAVTVSPKTTVRDCPEESRCPLSWCRSATARPLVGTEFFAQQARKTRQVDQVEGVVLAGKHRDRGALEPAHVFPRFLEGHRVVLRDRREDQIDQKAQPADLLVFVRYARGQILVSHRGGTIARSRPAVARRGHATRSLCSNRRNGRLVRL